MTAIKSVMGTEFTLARRIALSLIFSCAGIASGQNASDLPPSGAGSMSSSIGSGGFGAVDYSSSASMPVVSTDSSVANAGVSATPSALTASDLAGGGSSAHQSPPHLGPALSGGNQSPSNSATSAWRSGSSRGGSLNSLRAATSASSNGSGARQSSHSGQGVAAMESGLTGYKLESAATGAKLSSAQAKAGLSEEKEARSGSGSAAGSGAYANGFPDSTKNMAVINPPDLANVGLFSFSPGVSEGFPDLANYQFLRPTFHVGGGSSRGGSENTEDLYRRIEHRLKQYREAETPKNNGRKTEKGSHSSDFDNPFGSKTKAEDKLNKLSNPGSSF
jgi:hypothetical protein